MYLVLSQLQFEALETAVMMYVMYGNVEIYIQTDREIYMCKNLSQLAPLLKTPARTVLAKAVPCTKYMTIEECANKYIPKQEGTTPMRYNDNSAYATASVATQPTDASVTRDYLSNRLAKADYPKGRELRELFNLYVDNSPKTYKDLIDAIKNDKFSLDDEVIKNVADTEEEVGYGPFYGIIWNGPQPDKKGYYAALKE